MSGTDKNSQKLADVQGEYLAFPDPYKNAPSSNFDYRALVDYAKKMGKSINELTLEEKSQFAK